MTLPNFIIIGAAKAGTTSLWHYLGQHPQIFMSRVKEPDYFREEKAARAGVVRTLDEYEALFREAGSREAIGEASPSYIADPQTVNSIHALLPDARLIAILRDPCKRVFSEFTFQRMRGFEREPNFLDAVHSAPLRPGEQRFDYIGHSLYFRNLSRYYGAFPADHIKVVFNEDLRRDPQKLLGEICTFLGVDPNVKLDTEAELTVSGVPRVPALHWLLGRHNPIRDSLGPLLPEWARDIARQLKNANLVRQTMTPVERAALLPFFEEDTRQLERLLKVDLSHWRAA